MFNFGLILNKGDDQNLPVIATLNTNNFMSRPVHTKAEYQKVKETAYDDNRVELTYDIVFTLEAPFKLINSERKTTDLRLRFSLQAVVEIQSPAESTKHLVGNKITKLQLQLKESVNGHIITLKELCDELKAQHDVRLYSALQQDDFIDAQLFLCKGKTNPIFNYILEQMHTEHVFHDFLCDLKSCQSDNWMEKLTIRRTKSLEELKQDTPDKLLPWYKQIFSPFNSLSRAMN